MVTTEEQFLTVLEVAALLRISRRKAYRLIANNELPSIKIGSEYRIPRGELDQRLTATTSAGE